MSRTLVLCPLATSSRALLVLFLIAACGFKSTADDWRQLIIRADSLHEMSLHDSAVELGKTALRIAESESLVRDSSMAVVLCRLAEYCYSIQSPQSEVYADRALEIRELIFPPDHPDIALSLRGVSRMAGSDAERERMLKRAIRILENAPTRYFARLAETHCSLGTSYFNNGLYDNARAEYQKAWKVLELVPQDEQPDYFLPSLGLGNVHYMTKLLDSAEYYYRKCIEVRANHLNKEALTIGLNNLAAVFLLLPAFKARTGSI